MKSSPEKLAYMKSYYKANRERILAANAAWQALHYDEIRERRLQFSKNLDRMRREKGCADCGTRTGNLVFHHVDPGAKKYVIVRMATFSEESLAKELAKCVVLCDPCHRKRHVEMRRAIAASEAAKDAE